MVLTGLPNAQREIVVAISEIEGRHVTRFHTIDDIFFGPYNISGQLPDKITPSLMHSVVTDAFRRHPNNDPSAYLGKHVSRVLRTEYGKSFDDALAAGRLVNNYFAELYQMDPPALD